MAADSKIDLKPFCATERYRIYIHEPFTRGKWTYATNGHIMVRVPAIAEINGHPDAPAAERVWPKEWPQDWMRPEATALPSREFETCTDCKGRGTEHDCPSCTCECETCDGEGEIESPLYVAIGSARFALRYVVLLFNLPEVEIEPDPRENEPLRFRFDGGEGLLMPVRSSKEPCATVALRRAGQQREGRDE